VVGIAGAGYPHRPMDRDHRRQPRVGARRSACVLLLLVAGGVGGCSRGPDLDELPDVLVVVLGSVRADHSSLHDYELSTTPELDGLAREALRFERCHATSNRALASQASILSGEYPFQHRAGGAAGEPELRPLALEQRTLPEALDELGYRCAAFVSEEQQLSEASQLDQGFEDYRVLSGRGAAMNEAVAEWLTEVEGPCFLYLDYSDARPPFDSSALPDERAERIAPTGVVSTERLLERCAASPGAPDPEVLAELTARYDRGIAHADLALGGLLELMRSRERWESTLVIVTADCGFALGEHGRVGPATGMREADLHVPLVVRYPDGRRGAERELVSLADVPALVVEALPESLASELAGEFPRRSSEGLCLAEADSAVAPPARALWSRELKWIEWPGEEGELFDLSRDPHEERDLSTGRPEVAAELSARLDRYLRENPGRVAGGGSLTLDLPTEGSPRGAGYAGGGVDPEGPH